jgi:hypothetical protein
MLKRSSTTKLPVWGLVRWLASNLISVLVFTAIALCLARLDFKATQPASEPESDEPGGSGLIVRSEVLYVCMPQTLIDLAKRDDEAHVPSKHEDWKAALERHGHENICYGLLVRGHQVNGRWADITFVRYPHREPEHFQELLDVLAALAGRPLVGQPPLDCTGTTVQIAPPDSSREEILAGIKALSLSGEGSLRGSSKP